MHTPDPNTAEKIIQCVRAGISDTKTISKLVGVKIKDLETHYPIELGLTDQRDLIEVAQVAYDMAVSGRFPHMTQWWLRVKGGHQWSEGDTGGSEVAPITVILNGNRNDTAMIESDSSSLQDGDHEPVH